jgi:valyl-tRNA synthetase
MTDSNFKEPNIDPKLLKPYNPQETEPRIYKLWAESGYFNPDNLPTRHQKPYTIIMPPPNATGVLHMGHALGMTTEDIFIRYHRMAGFKTLWLPGTDHASIATQSKVEKEILKTEGKSRYDLGREELLKRIETFVEDSRHTIAEQTKIIGASCDWSRAAFTLDEKRSLAVRTVFKKMYDDGLIFRKNRIVNWDPKGQTTISDDEIVYEERDAKFYTFKYSTDFPISISTTRPETKVGDVAVAVHPEDVRYQKYIGQTFKIEDFCGVPLEIKVIADTEVDPEFGTGALGVTPAHSMVDWQMAEKNNLPVIQVIDEKARMMIGGENIKGKKVTEAREVIITWLKEKKLLEKEEIVKQNVSTAERTGGIIEPLPKLQWWVAVNKPFTLKFSNIPGLVAGSQVTLKDIMRHAVSSGQVKIIPTYFDKTYFSWIDKLNDWCISRQIWYGHRLPVWYKTSNDGREEIYTGLKAPEGAEWHQDEDTLDTWFSSSLWTFSTLGWPEAFDEKTGQAKPGTDLAFFHPTQILETGYEILFFWVARMILMSSYSIGQIPFENVYLHGTVRDDKGRKFSKSLGNGIDPIDVAKKFGSDAGRLSLVIGNTPGTDFKFSEDKLRAQSKFANKVWNATRFVLSSIEDFKTDSQPELTAEDQKTIEEMQTLVNDITKDIEEFRLYMAGDKIYNFFWHTFADIVIERTKPAINGTDIISKQSAQYTLFTILSTMIKVLHPFMPFVTEEIWSLLDIKNKKLLMIEEWPKF